MARNGGGKEPPTELPDSENNDRNIEDQNDDTLSEREKIETLQSHGNARKSAGGQPGRPEEEGSAHRIKDNGHDQQPKILHPVLEGNLFHQFLRFVQDIHVVLLLRLFLGAALKTINALSEDNWQDSPLCRCTGTRSEHEARSLGRFLRTNRSDPLYSPCLPF